MLRIMAGMHQKDSCPRRTGYWIIWQLTLLCFRLKRNAWSPVVHAMRQFWAGSRPALYFALCLVRQRIHAVRQSTGVFHILRELVEYGSSGRFSTCSFSAFAVHDAPRAVFLRCPQAPDARHHGGMDQKDSFLRGFWWRFHRCSSWSGESFSPGGA